jgi:hypothetical protein
MKLQKPGRISEFHLKREVNRMQKRTNKFVKLSSYFIAICVTPHTTTSFKRIGQKDTLRQVKLRTTPEMPLNQCI